MGKTPAVMFAQIFGAVYLLIGIAGLFVVDGTGFASQEGGILLGLEVNMLHNLVHLAIGIALLAASRSAMMARQMNTAVGAVLLLVGILGFFIMDTDLDILALNWVDNLIHLATAALALTVGRKIDQRATSRV